MSEPLNWHTSTYTKTDNCVEVADNIPNLVLIRDTKDRQLPVVTSTTEAWSAFIASVK
ncbi:DUF397 domain-containing protein [Streptomyces sp. NPDC051561]|uniref:DUF397 domain-containing protein n=1 Tax=Streptomyces sp. NPDC051561 TaxID=3365658 RepID=UPI0037B725CA